ncbi:hypothetical protein [Winogradskyella sp. A3E31]|uniref:hypothetical protein n=1 Tax=Winogradskyella sp. A3E31 TaxID=3349637 RepID=UPI00398A86E1
MKKLLIFCLCLVSIVSCKNDSKSDSDIDSSSKSYDQNDGLITMRGDFIFDENQNAAVLKTQNDIYGVVLDDVMHQLNEKVKPLKKEYTDMVPVTVRVRRFEKDTNEEGWQYKVEIKEILKIEAPDPNQDDVIKLEN